MHRLFWKIFGWFWGAMILIVLTLYFVVLTSQPDPLPVAWRDTAETGLRITGRNAAQAYESGGQTALANYFSKEARLPNTRFWLYNSFGQELTGVPLPDPTKAASLQNGNSPTGNTTTTSNANTASSDTLPEGPRSGLLGILDASPAPPSPEQIEKLRDRAVRDQEAIFQNAGPRTMSAVLVQSPGGKSYVLAALMPSPQFGRTTTDPQTQFLGGLAAIAISGLFCFWLVSYLTGPLVKLRAATRQLAEGNLSARIGAQSTKRRDEVTDLGRDFDAMAERIEILMSAQTQLLGDISHELRSPLTRISMALALAKRHATNGTTSEELIGTLDRIGRETGRLNILIGQLLELTRLESGEATRERIDLAQLAREVVSDAEFEAKNMGKQVHIIAQERCPTNGSRELLRSALDNVIRNALRHTEPGTTVHVNLLRHNEFILVRVRDHGTGAPNEALKKLFEPFFRVEIARDRRSGGVGLGLAITQRAIRSHGGNITARNSDKGGLEIIMSLPAEDWEAEIDRIFEEETIIPP